MNFRIGINIKLRLKFYLFIFGFVCCKLINLKYKRTESGAALRRYLYENQNQNRFPKNIIIFTPILGDTRYPRLRFYTSWNDETVMVAEGRGRCRKCARRRHVLPKPNRVWALESGTNPERSFLLTHFLTDSGHGTKYVYDKYKLYRLIAKQFITN